MVLEIEEVRGRARGGGGFDWCRCGRCECGGVECGVCVWGCRSVCGAQCVAVVLVISRAGIGPEPEEACKRETEERKER